MDPREQPQHYATKVDGTTGVIPDMQKSPDTRGYFCKLRLRSGGKGYLRKVMMQKERYVNDDML